MNGRRLFAGLCGAVEALQSKLRANGSDLLIVEGKAAELIPELAQQYNASCILAEEEVEYRSGLHT